MDLNSAMKKRLTQWQRWKRNAPKVPDITCPDIDAVISKLEKYINTGTKYQQRNHNAVVRVLEKLRSANDRLRESGEYWYSITKQNYKK